jgi:drug/metabolite transporter (DMT)-like permease
MFIWGASWVSIKILTSMATPMIIGFARYSLASFLFLLLLIHRGSSLRGIFNSQTMRSLVVGGITGIFAFMVLSLMATRFTTAAQASILAGLNPIFVSFFAYLIHKERLAASWRYLGISIAFVGVIFVVGVQSFLNFNFEYLAGNIIMIFAILAWGVYSTTGNAAMKIITPAEATAGSIFVGGIIFGFGAITEIGTVSPVFSEIDFWWNVVFLAVFSSFFGFLMYFEAIKRIGAIRTSGFTSLIPVFGTITSIIILQEQIYWTFIVGLILVVMGILILNAPDKKELPESVITSSV